MILSKSGGMCKAVISFIILMILNIFLVQAQTVNVLGYTYTAVSDSSRGDQIFRQVLDRQYNGVSNAPEEKILAKLRKSENKTGVFLITVLLLYLFGGIRMVFSRQFAGSLGLIQNWQRMPKKLPENDSIAVLSFYVLYFIALGFVLFFYISRHWDFLKSFPVAISILVCIATVFILFMFRLFMMYLLSWVFGFTNTLKEYFENVLITYKLSAIILFPFAIIIILSKSGIADFFLQFSLILLIAALVFRYIRNAGLMKKLLSMHFLHFFMYLCAFEMIPLWVIVKLIR